MSRNLKEFARSWIRLLYLLVHLLELSPAEMGNNTRANGVSQDVYGCPEPEQWKKMWDHWSIQFSHLLPVLFHRPQWKSDRQNLRRAHGNTITMVIISYPDPLKASPKKRTNTGNSQQIFQEKELRGHSPNFHIHVSVSDLYMYYYRQSAYSAAGNMWTDPGNTEIAHRRLNVETEPVAAQFPEKEFINGIFVAVPKKKLRHTHTEASIVHGEDKRDRLWGEPHSVQHHHHGHQLPHPPV